MTAEPYYRWNPPVFDEAEDAEDCDPDWEPDWDADEDTLNGIYRRTPAEATRPTGSLLITGPQQVTSRATDLYADHLTRYDFGTTATAELVPEPGNPWDDTAVAVDVDGHRVGYLPAGTAYKRHAAIVAINATGRRVLTNAEIGTRYEDDPRTPENKILWMGLPYPHSLGIWLTLPPQMRDHGFTEPWEVRRTLTNQFQEPLARRFSAPEDTVQAVPLILVHDRDSGRLDARVDGTTMAIIPTDSPDHATVLDLLNRPGVAFRLFTQQFDDTIMAKIQVWGSPRP